MRFEWNVNPLETAVFLDDADRKLLRMAIRLDAAIDAISYRDLRDSAKTPEDAERYSRYLKNYDNVAFDEVPEDIDEQVVMYESELQGSHVGDCICFACSCMKCRAESLLDIDTIAGLSTHEASKIDSCFTDTSTTTWSRKTLTSAEVIEELSKPVSRTKNEHWKNSTQEMWDACIPRWETERARALNWYRQYIEEHNL